MPHLALLAAPVCLLLLVVAPVAAHDHDHGSPSRERYSWSELYRPTPVPDRLVLTWSDDPATSIDVTYRTDAGGTQTLCEWIEASRVLGNHKTGGIPGANRLQGTSEPLKTNLFESRMHTVRLRELPPATRIAYRVGDGANWTPWNHFTTAHEGFQPFEFLYFGDAQNEVRSLWARVRREAHAEAPRAAFALHAGDLINRAESDGEWCEWFEAAGWLNATVPTVATPGNHEYGRVGLSKRLTRLWRPQFSFPTNGPEGLEETCYWFDYQGVRFISLNSNERLEEQAEWLDKLLTELPPARWTIVTHHHPVYSAARDRDDTGLRVAWKPIYDKHGVHLALQGHDHTYARTGMGGPVEENTAEGARTATSKTVYVVSVSGPKRYQINDAWEVSRKGTGVQLYQVIRVEEDAIRYRAYRASGEVYDGFTIHRAGDGVRLEEEIPETPEILR